MYKGMTGLWSHNVWCMCSCLMVNCKITIIIENAENSGFSIDILLLKTFFWNLKQCKQIWCEIFVHNDCIIFHHFKTLCSHYVQRLHIIFTKISHHTLFLQPPHDLPWQNTSVHTFTNHCVTFRTTPEPRTYETETEQDIKKCAIYLL